MSASSTTHAGVRSKLFLVGSDGKLIARRPGVWSAKWDKCQMCGTTEKPHEGKGYCRNCFARWRRATNYKGYRDRQNACSKRRSLRTNYQEEYDAKRQFDPKRREQRRAISLRWAKKNAKFAPSKLVKWEIIAGHWIEGVVHENGRGFCLVSNPLTGSITRVAHKDLVLICKELANA